MQRDFSVIRRRPNLLDVVIPINVKVDAYRLEWATNFDQSYTTILTSSRFGHVDDSLRNMVHALVDSNKVRIIFDPANYSITDSKAFWMRLVPVTGVIDGTPSAGGMILPDGGGYKAVIVAGSAPSGATVASSLRLDFPRLVEDLRIVNLDGTNSLFVADEIGGSEYEVKGGASSNIFSNLRGCTDSLLVRGAGGAVKFSATCTLAYPR
jgi:hypothetical protein